MLYNRNTYLSPLRKSSEQSVKTCYRTPLTVFTQSLSALLLVAIWSIYVRPLSSSAPIFTYESSNLDLHNPTHPLTICCTLQLYSIHPLNLPPDDASWIAAASDHYFLLSITTLKSPGILSSGFAAPASPVLQLRHDLSARFWYRMPLLESLVS